MGELADIVRLYRAVDEAVMERSEATAELVALLPAYADPRTVGWVERVTAAGPRIAEDRRSTEEVLDSMAKRNPEGRLRSRRLLAIAALLRADVSFRTDDRRLLTESALAPLMPPDSMEIAERKTSLADLLIAFPIETSIPSPLSHWEQLLEEAGRDGLVAEDIAAQRGPSCSTEMTSFTVGGDTDPVFVLLTSFTDPDLSVDGMTRFLDPENWPHCSELWCSMERNNPGATPSCYLEIISFDCTANPRDWELKTCLEFQRSNLPNGGGACLEYWMCRDPAHVALGDGRVKVDEGSIVVKPVAGGGISVSTTKRIAFEDSLSGPTIAMWACATGYAAAGQEMAYSCAKLGGQNAADWPVDLDAFGPTTQHTTTTGTAGEDSDAEQRLDALIDRTSAYCAEVAAAAQRSFHTAVQGEYTADTFVRDVAEGWARLIGFGLASVRSDNDPDVPGGEP